MIDRTLAHLSDMLDFVRELRALVGATALETERALVEHLARRGGDG